MYTLLELQSKTFGELKKIGWELNVLPEGDRRRRETWIDAIAGVNLPLLQLLEVSPAAEVVKQVQPIIETVEAFPGVEVEPVQEAPQFKVGDLVQSKTMLWGIEKESLTGTVISVLPNRGVRVCFGDVESGYGGTLDFSKANLEDLIPVQEAIEPIDAFVNTSQRQEAIEPIDAFVNTSQRQEAIARSAENCPSVEVDDCVYCASPEYSSLRDKSYRCYRCQPDEADLNPILTGIPLSDRFLARYTPPQSHNIHFQVEADGQLSLIDFEVLTEPEPPDPDDFDSLDAFREAIARWDREHPISSDHFSNLLPNSVQNEPPDPYELDSMFAFWAAYDAWDEASDDDSEPLKISLDSFCEWAPCPLDWYEPADLLEPSKVSELSPVAKSSITSDFFIPTFGSLGDRFDRNDEPPDTDIFARLPKPKPPKFPPQASQPKQVRRASRNYPETIPKQFSRVAAGSSTQPARSPPGGDA